MVAGLGVPIFRVFTVVNELFLIEPGSNHLPYLNYFSK